MNFSFKGRNGRGELVEGIVDATSSDAVAAQLMAGGVVPVSIEPTAEAVTTPGGSNWLEALLAKPISQEDALVLTRQMYTLQKAGVPESALKKVVIAGAFGSYISVASAVTIGMFPRLPLERFVQVGNAAGMGARMALISRAERQRAAAIAAQAEYVELTSTPEFTEEFAQAMFLA